MMIVTKTRIEREKFPTHYQLYLGYGSKLGWHGTLWDQLPRWIGQKHFYCYLYYQWSRICSGFTQNLDLWGPRPRERRHRIVRRAGRQAAFGVEAVGAGPNTESPSSSKHNIFRKCAQRRQLLMIIGDKCSVCTFIVGWNDNNDENEPHAVTTFKPDLKHFRDESLKICSTLLLRFFHRCWLHGLRLVGTFLQPFLTTEIGRLTTKVASTKYFSN